MSINKNDLGREWCARRIPVDASGSCVGIEFLANSNEMPWVFVSKEELEKMGTSIEEMSANRFFPLTSPDFVTDRYAKYGFPSVTLQHCQTSKVEYEICKKESSNHFTVYYPGFYYRYLPLSLYLKKIYQTFTAIDLETSLGFKNAYTNISGTFEFSICINGAINGFVNEDEFQQQTIDCLCNGFNISSADKNAQEEIRKNTYWNFEPSLNGTTNVDIKITLDPSSLYIPIPSPPKRARITLLQKFFLENQFVNQFKKLPVSQLELMSYYPWNGTERLILLCEKSKKKEVNECYAVSTFLPSTEEEIINQLFVPNAKIIPEILDPIGDKILPDKISRSFKPISKNFDIEDIIAAIENEIDGYDISVSGDILTLSRKFHPKLFY